MIRNSVVIIEQTHKTAGAIGSGVKSTSHTTFTLALVISAAADKEVVRFAGTSYNTRFDTLGRSAKAIALSDNLQETAQRVVAELAEPVEFDTIEAARGFIAQHYKAAPYKAKYDRRGRLVPVNSLIRDEQAAQRRALLQGDGIACGLEPAYNGRFEFPYAAQFAGKSFEVKCSAARELVAYASAIGQKSGRLPVNLKSWSAAIRNHDGSTALVAFMSDRETVEIECRWLDWSPAEPVEELMSEAA